MHIEDLYPAIHLSNGSETLLLEFYCPACGGRKSTLLSLAGTSDAYCECGSFTFMLDDEIAHKIKSSVDAVRKSFQQIGFFQVL